MQRIHHTPRTSLCVKGFSLIELLITLVCIAVLTSMAWPSYQSLMLRSQRAQARAALLQAAHWLERAASANGSYPSLSAVPTSVLQVEGLRYQLSLTGAAQSYTLSASPLGTQAADECGILSITHLGLRSVQGAKQTAAYCWGQ